MKDIHPEIIKIAKLRKKIEEEYYKHNFPHEGYLKFIEDLQKEAMELDSSLYKLLVHYGII